jgi:hypothetical protein
VPPEANGTPNGENAVEYPAPKIPLAIAADERGTNAVDAPVRGVDVIPGGEVV